jgi:hypothetical protein
MYTQRTSILTLIAAAAVGLAMTSAPALAKGNNQSSNHNVSSPHNNSSGSNHNSGPVYSSMDKHDSDKHDSNHCCNHDPHKDYDSDWYKKHHHEHDHYYYRDRYIPVEQERPYVVRPVVANPSPDRCLTKDYLEPSTVMFKDVCTKQWAKNDTNVATRAATDDPKCLRKENLQGGGVLFKDLCTGEWAMN